MAKHKSRGIPSTSNLYITIATSATSARDPFNRTHTVQLPTRCNGIGISVRDTYGRAYNDRQTYRASGYTAETYPVQMGSGNAGTVTDADTLVTPNGIRIRK